MTADEIPAPFRGPVQALARFLDAEQSDGLVLLIAAPSLVATSDEGQIVAMLEHAYQIAMNSVAEDLRAGTGHAVGMTVALPRREDSPDELS